jgi:hypothetical protein
MSSPVSKFLQYYEARMHVEDCSVNPAEREASEESVLGSELSRSELAARAKQLAASAVYKLPLTLRHGVVIQKYATSFPHLELVSLPVNRSPLQVQLLPFRHH